MAARPPTAGAILVTILILVTAAATAVLFSVPLTSRLFWPTAGVLIVALALAWLIPIKPRT